jgi:hypothetical protein
MAAREIEEILSAILGAARKPLAGAELRAAEKAARAAAQPIRRAPKPGEKLSIPNINIVQKARLDPQEYGSVKLSRPIEAYTPTTVASNRPLMTKKTVTLEDLEGGYLLPLYGDRSAGEGLLSRVGDLDLQRQYALEGGVDFMRGPAAQDDKAMWASAKHIIDSLARASGKAPEGADVYGVTVSMAPDALDFASFTPRAAADILQQSALPKKTVSAFDEQMRGSIPSWPGLMSEDLDAFLLTTTPNNRKAFLRYVDSEAAAKAGIPSDVTAAARYAVTDPAQRAMGAGQAGLGISRVNRNAPILTDPSVPHSTYPVQMVGEEYVGGLQMPLDQSMLWPEAFADFATRVVTDKKTGKTSPFNAAHKTYAMKMELPLQRVTPEMVDQYMLGVERAKARGLLD